MKKSDFYFDLPEELIAQTPLAVQQFAEHKLGFRKLPCALCNPFFQSLL